MDLVTTGAIIYRTRLGAIARMLGCGDASDHDQMLTRAAHLQDAARRLSSIELGEAVNGGVPLPSILLPVDGRGETMPPAMIQEIVRMALFGVMPPGWPVCGIRLSDLEAALLRLKLREVERPEAQGPHDAKFWALADGSVVCRFAIAEYIAMRVASLTLTSIDRRAALEKIDAYGARAPSTPDRPSGTVAK